MTFEKILVVYKKSNYEKYILEDHYLKLKRHKALTKPLLDSHRNHYRSLEHVERVLKNMGVKFSMMVRSNAFSEKKYDLVISVGGDGTFLDASQFMFNTPLLGINSNPIESIGHFCPITSKQLQGFLQKKHFHIVKLSRLRVSIDRKILAPAAIAAFLAIGETPSGFSLEANLIHLLIPNSLDASRMDFPAL
jgi:NAD kinase